MTPRHFCRNCRSKFKALVESDHRAFCCRGCHAQFYRKRCVVCERSIERTVHNRRLCERRKCGADFRAFPHLYVYRLDDPSSASKPTSETPGFIGSITPIRRHIAGPKLSARSFALATLPLEPKFAARIARQNRAGGVARSVPVNLLGGYRFASADPCADQFQEGKSDAA
jgi:hypothetical protein